MSELSLVHALGLEIPSSRLLERFGDFVVETPGEALRPLRHGPLRQQPQQGGEHRGGPAEHQDGDQDGEVKTKGDAQEVKQSSTAPAESSGDQVDAQQ
eukprot:Skav226160  [mRNA]  locus=scaffold3275:82770:83063:+ [translate_table: standard]